MVTNLLERGTHALRLPDQSVISVHVTEDDVEVDEGGAGGVACWTDTQTRTGRLRHGLCHQWPPRDSKRAQPEPRRAERVRVRNCRPNGIYLWATGHTSSFPGEARPNGAQAGFDSACGSERVCDGR